jgi:uncharacterized protein involved in tellurium resistance
VSQDYNLNVVGLAIPLTFQPDVLINKSGGMLNGVQNRLNLQWHRGSLVGWFAFIFNSQTKPIQIDPRCVFTLPENPGRSR